MNNPISFALAFLVAAFCMAYPAQAQTPYDRGNTARIIVGFSPAALISLGQADRRHMEIPPRKSHVRGAKHDRRRLDGGRQLHPQCGETGWLDLRCGDAWPLH